MAGSRCSESTCGLCGMCDAWFEETHGEVPGPSERRQVALSQALGEVAELDGWRVVERIIADVKREQLKAAIMTDQVLGIHVTVLPQDWIDAISQPWPLGRISLGCPLGRAIKRTLGVSDADWTNPTYGEFGAATVSTIYGKCYQADATLRAVVAGFGFSVTPDTLPTEPVSGTLTLLPD